MTLEEKQLLLKDLCARLPYGVKVRIEGDWFYDEKEPYDITLKSEVLGHLIANAYSVKPYLRPMSSMTEEERNELSTILNYEFYADVDFALVAEDDRHRIRLELCEGYIDWLNKNHFDYRGLIEEGLALEAPDDMYNKKEK